MLANLFEPIVLHWEFHSSCGANACEGLVKQVGEHPPAEGQDSKVLGTRQGGAFALLQNALRYTQDKQISNCKLKDAG